MKKELSELEFWGVRYTYEAARQTYKDDLDKIFSLLNDRWGKDIVELYKKACTTRLPHCERVGDQEIWIR